jgi:hypothetical protein
VSYSADDFVSILTDGLSPLVQGGERHVRIDFKSSRGFTSRPGASMIAINFFNLPTARVKERRGGGAEAENNRMLFMVNGFDEDSATPVAKVKLEQSVSSIGHHGNWAPKMRAKSGSPDKVAIYLANYINEIASMFPPNFTHE